MAGLQSSEGRVIIDAVIWAQYINATDTQTATSPQQQRLAKTLIIRVKLASDAV